MCCGLKNCRGTELHFEGDKQYVSLKGFSIQTHIFFFSQIVGGVYGQILRQTCWKSGINLAVLCESDPPTWKKNPEVTAKHG